MKKRALALLLCICMAAACFVYYAADGEQLGDANGDGRISAADASLALRYVVGLDHHMSTRNKICADIDINGAIEADDAVAILRHVARLQYINQVETDTELLGLLNQQAVLSDSIMTEWVARFIQSLPEGDVRNVLYAGAAHIGKPYGTKTGQLDCSLFVRAAYEDAGIPKTVYPGKSSNDTLAWFQNTRYPERQQYIHETDDSSWKDWKPGCVLIYINASTMKGSHLALYVGEIDGMPVVMESRKNPVNGVRVGYLMGSDPSWTLAYYVDPLG